MNRISSIGLSQWRPQYVPPVVDIKRLEAIDEPEEREWVRDLAFRPIIARQSCHSCSLFYDHMLNRFISKAHMRGHKALMKDLMRQTFAVIKRIQIEKYNGAEVDNKVDNKVDVECDPLVIFHTALENCRPLIITRPIKRGGATYQVPYPLKLKESEEMGMRWIVQTVRERPKPRTTFFPEAMAKELIDAYYNEGKVVKRKQDVHRVCEANRAYAHYRWG